MKPIFDRRAIPSGLRIGEWRGADGWPMRRFDWEPPEGKARGSILFQAGRGDFLEKYLEALAHWCSRGWRITGFDWRGQGGSGRFLSDSRVGHSPGLDPLLDDLDAFTSEWFAASPGPQVLIGHSMGGHLMLRLLAERNIRPDAAVLIGPMLGLNTGRIPVPLARAFAHFMSRIGLNERPAWREDARPTGLGISRQPNLTSSVERYEDESWWKARHPELALEAPSWGWLAAAFDSIARLERPGMLEGVTTPILMLAAAHDRLVSPAAIRKAAKRLPDARLIMSDEGAHELLREIDAVRLPLFAEIDRFLDERAGQG